MENTFEWTSELVFEFTSNLWTSDYAKRAMERFIESKIRQPLFTTKDNVPIYESDTCWGLVIDGTYPYKWERVIEEGFIKSHTYFSTEEKAKEYVLMNRPLLSLNDVMEHVTNPVIYHELKELAKSKLK